MPAAKEQIRQMISENNLNSDTDVYALLRDSFKDILQELMEAQLDATLGFEKNRKGDLQTDNKRNGHSTKNLKSQYGEFQIDVPRDRNGEFEPKLIPKYQRDISGIEEKVISLYEMVKYFCNTHKEIISSKLYLCSFFKWCLISIGGMWTCVIFSNIYILHCCFIQFFVS